LAAENTHQRLNVSVSSQPQIHDPLGDPASYSPPPALRTITVRDFGALAPHHAAWDRLACEAPQKLPMLLPGWIDAFLRHRLKASQHWLCCFAYVGERLVGVLPVIVTPHWLLGASRPYLSTPIDAHTPSGDVLLASEHAEAAFRALLAEVGRQVPNHLGLEIKAIRQSSPMRDTLKRDFADYSIRRTRHSMYSFLDVTGDFDSYLAGLGNMRKNLRRYRRKLENRGSVSVELRTGATADAQFLPEFLDLEASGWKGRCGTAIANSPSTVAFYETLIRNLAAQGRWEWHVIRVGERIVAAEMAVCSQASLVLLKYTFDEDFADCRPGHLLTEEVYKDAFSRSKIDEINHMSLSASDQYWRMAQDEYVDVHLVRRHAAAILLQLPPFIMRSMYQDFVRPRIPTFLKQTYHKFKHRSDRKPRRITRDWPIQATAAFILSNFTTSSELQIVNLLAFV
jgi:CelD/BcsL family acetyltransferase involved in cellulose biosynthesis